MRIFIAFPVAKTIQTEAADLSRILKDRYPYLMAKWVEPGNLHVTLEFFGSITERELLLVKKILIYQTKKVLPFLYSVTGITAFPTTINPQTIVLSVSEVDTAFGMLLRKAVHDELVLHNISNDFKLWKPHLTLARIKNEKISLPGLREIKCEPQIWQVDYLELISSQLTSGGARYTVLEKYTLG